MNRMPSLAHIMCVALLCIILTVVVFILATSTDFAIQIVVVTVLMGSFIVLSGYALMRLRIDLF